MVQLNGYFESNYNKQVFDSYLQKDLMIANNNLAIKRTMTVEHQSQYAINEHINKYNKLTMEMATSINKALLDEHNKVNVSSMAFYEYLSPLLLHDKIKDPIVNFSLLYNNKPLIKKTNSRICNKDT
ncbi:hypothetical protein UB38_17305 [Photobacterium iliopiscarium]|nr:hypothetical protein UB38_17305 [Photobacterium iliopiscarium]